MTLLLSLVMVYFASTFGVWGQVYLSLGSNNITTNNTEILITDIGEDTLGGLPRLTCHTDLTECCRNRETGGQGGRGEWYYPDGRMVQNYAGSIAAGEGFYRVRNAPQVIRLALRGSYYSYVLSESNRMGPLYITGSYCCVIPTTGGVMTFCAKLVVCRSLSPLLNGRISYSDPPQDLGSVASHTCDIGSTLNGSRIRTCNVIGTWSGSAPSCTKVQCPVLPSVTNGKISYSDPSLSVNTSANYSCDLGYTLNSRRNNRICQANGTWSGPTDLSCEVGCGQLDAPANGRVVTPSGTAPGSVAQYECNIGYKIEGLSTRLCLSTGIWVPEAPYCRIVDCGLPSAPANGRVHTSPNTTYNSTATYHCDSGYRLTKNTSRTCQANGSWSDGQPECRPVNCGNLTAPLNGQLTINGMTYLSEATYTCDSGYRVWGPATRSCNASGLWTPSEPFCKSVDCSNLASPCNGSVNTSSGTTFMSVASYGCDVGYTLNGSTSRVCDANGTWTPPFPPTCQVVDCGPLPALTNGRIHASLNTTYNSVATYSCYDGYNLTQEISRSCQASGNWSNSQPECIPVNCGNVTVPLNGRVTLNGTKYLNTATYTCDSGYRVGGPANRSCNASGLWTPNEPLCKPVDCGNLTPPSNGHIDMSFGTTFMSIAQYSCDVGFKLNVKGSSYPRVCEANGIWSPQLPPICLVVDCGALKDPENGHVRTQFGTTYSHVANYSCEKGHQLNGSSSRNCTASGHWSPAAPTCDPVNCGNLHDPKNGHVDTSQGTLFNTTTYYSCDPGYNLTGCSSARCLSTGNWSCDPPFCADNAMIQLKFGPTQYCVQWTDWTVNLMYMRMQSLVLRAIHSSGHVIPKKNIQQGYFSCFRSTTETTYRTTITGTEKVSAVGYADLIQEWVESGVTTRVQWYVIKIDKNCPVSIMSEDDVECESKFD